MKSNSSSGVQVVFLWTGTAFCSSTVLNPVQEHVVVQLCSRCQQGDTRRNSTGQQGVEIFVAGNHLCAIAGTQASSGCLCEPLMFGSQTCSCISSCLEQTPAVSECTAQLELGPHRGSANCCPEAVCVLQKSPRLY